MPTITTRLLKFFERLLLLAKVFFDGLDRVGATIVAVSFIGGLLAPETSAMTTSAAWMGGFIGLMAILIGGYIKDRLDATLRDIRDVLRAEQNGGGSS